LGRIADRGNGARHTPSMRKAARQEQAANIPGASTHNVVNRTRNPGAFSVPIESERGSEFLFLRVS
jgi:hypothetical protein